MTIIIICTNKEIHMSINICYEPMQLLLFHGFDNLKNGT